MYSRDEPKRLSSQEERGYAGKNRPSQVRGMAWPPRDGKGVMWVREKRVPNESPGSRELPHKGGSPHFVAMMVRKDRQ